MVGVLIAKIKDRNKWDFLAFLQSAFLLLCSLRFV